VRDEKAKSQRNIELVRKQIAEGEATPFLHFNLGSELAASGNAAAALEEFRTAWNTLKAEGTINRHPYVASLGNKLVQTHRAVRRYDDAQKAAEDVLEHFPGYTDIVLEQAIIARDQGDKAMAAALFNRCLEMGDAPSKYSPTVGAGTYLPLLFLSELAREDGRLDEAEQLVRRCLSEHPRFLAIVEPYASVRLANGADATDVVDEIHSALSELTPGARFMLAVALHEHGAAEPAETELREVVAAQPHSPHARLALVEALLSQSKFAEAAETAAEVDPESPLADAASRARVFASLAGGDVPAAAEALAAATELSDDERAALAAWTAAAAGEQTPDAIPAGAAGNLVLMLEALARVEAFDAFETLVGRFETLDIPWREKRELLAGVYLRRGFYDSAADEWITACEQEGADVPAMMGLAQVAWAKGLEEDAKAFAEEAHALDPADPATGLLVERLAAATA
jgi:tetratricopeptide (TPR) repeat protein